MGRAKVVKMSQLLAIEWDAGQARLAVASLRGNRVLIEHAFAVPLRVAGPDGQLTEVDPGQQIAAALASRGVGKIDTLVAVGRSSIELRHLTLPPVPDDELPGAVRFEAMREFNELDDDWSLDFIPIGEPGQSQRSVLAAAISPELIEQIRATCQAAGLRPKSLVLRPCAVASLYNRAQLAAPEGMCLLVDLLGDEADLTVVFGRQVVFLRTARLSGDPLEGPEHAQSLIAELRRTIAAAQNQLAGQRVESIVLLGEGPGHNALAEALQGALDRPTTLFDPLAGLELSAALRQALPTRPEQFAPLLGMLVAELEQTGQAIDFLHPRRPPVPPDRRKPWIIAAAAVALLVLVFLGWQRLQVYWLTAEIQELDSQLQRLNAEVAEAEQREAKVAEIEKWMATDVAWLEELAYLSRKMPPAKQAMVTMLTCKTGTVGGEMLVEGLVDTEATIQLVYDGLHAPPNHQVGGKTSSRDDSDKRYTWKFGASVRVGEPKPKPIAPKTTPLRKPIASTRTN